MSQKQKLITSLADRHRKRGQQTSTFVKKLTWSCFDVVDIPMYHRCRVWSFMHWNIQLHCKCNIWSQSIWVPLFCTHSPWPCKQASGVIDVSPLSFISGELIDMSHTHTWTDILPSKWCDQSQCLKIVLLHLVWIWVVISRVISGCAKEIKDLVAFQGSLPHGRHWFKSFRLKVSFKKHHTRSLCQHDVNAKRFQKYKNKHKTRSSYNS